MAEKMEEVTHEACGKSMLAIKDAVEILEGKWKVPILLSLYFGPKRFKEISRDINGITDRMLSKELKLLEMNKLITRTVYDKFPPAVIYEISEHGKSLYTVIDALKDWGVKHRKNIIGN